jgi:hypothetical protein
MLVMMVRAVMSMVAVVSAIVVRIPAIIRVMIIGHAAIPVGRAIGSNIPIVVKRAAPPNRVAISVIPDDVLVGVYRRSIWTIATDIDGGVQASMMVVTGFGHRRRPKQRYCCDGYCGYQCFHNFPGFPVFSGLDASRTDLFDAFAPGQTSRQPVTVASVLRLDQDKGPVPGCRRSRQDGSARFRARASRTRLRRALRHWGWR